LTRPATEFNVLDDEDDEELYVPFASGSRDVLIGYVLA
jgi:hypothetical protein